MNSGARPIDVGGVKKERNLRTMGIFAPSLKEEDRGAHTSDKRIEFVIQRIGIVSDPYAFATFFGTWILCPGLTVIRIIG